MYLTAGSAVNFSGLDTKEEELYIMAIIDFDHFHLFLVLSVARFFLSLVYQIFCLLKGGGEICRWFN